MNVNELRAEVLRRQKAANAKVARLRRKGVYVAGTDFDIRRGTENIGRYNSRQLQAYLGKLNEFTSRRNAFVPGSEGAPIRAEKWRAFQRQQRTFNQTAREHYETVANIHNPQAGMSVGEFDTSVRSNRKGAKGGGPARPFAPRNHESFEIANEKALDALTRDISKRNRKEYLPGELKRQRKQMLMAVNEFGDPELTKKARELTDDQFDVLWNYTDAPRDMFSGYHFLKLLAAGKADEAQASIHEDASYETRQYVEWASNLPARKKPNRKNRR